MNITSAKFLDNKLTFFSSSTPENQNSIELESFSANKMSQGFKGFFETLDPRRVRINLSRGTSVFLKNNEVGKFLDISSFRIFLYRLFAWENVEELVLKKFKDPKFVQVFLKKITPLCPNGITKLSRKDHDLCLTSSILIEKTDKELRPLSLDRNQEQRVIIGEGAFKTAKRVTNLSTGEHLVLVTSIKKMNLPWIIRDNNQQKLEEEIKFYEKLKNIPNFSQGKRFNWINKKTRKKTGILMPLYQDTMESARGKLLQKEKNLCAYELASAANYLIKNNLMHFDIKPDNIFIQPDAKGVSHAFVGDFGGIREYTTFYQDGWNGIKYLFGRHQKINNIFTNGVECTNQWSAPEVRSQSINQWDREGLEKAVVFSVGKTLEAWFQNSQSGNLGPLIAQMMRRDPKDRPTMEQVVKSISKAIEL